MPSQGTGVSSSAHDHAEGRVSAASRDTDLLDESLNSKPIIRSEGGKEELEMIAISDADVDEPSCCVREGMGFKLSPFVLLLVFIYVNLLNYIDRGLVAGILPTYCVNCPDILNVTSCTDRRSCSWEAENGTCIFNASVHPQFGIGGSFDISEVEQGVLAGAFMGGYCVFSPAFAQFSTLYPPFLLMAGGLGVWTLSATMAATSQTYHGLLIARVLSGIGEASFQCLAPPFIDDSASTSQKGKWLAAFFMAVPTGQALGYAYGGAVCSSIDSDSLGFASWRLAFVMEAVAMVPIVAMCLFLTNRFNGDSASPSKGQFDDNSNEPGHAHAPPKSACARAMFDVWRIMSNKIWVCAVLGYGAFTFTVGAIAVWAPYYLQKRFLMSLEEADVMFGVVAIITGVLGTAFGGIILDNVTRRLKGDIMSSSLLVTVMLTLLSWPFCFMSFTVTTIQGFFLFVFVGQFLAFATTSPLNGVLLWCVDPELRTLSMALAVVGMHLLGDVPSPVVVGGMLEYFKNPSGTMQIVTLWIGWCVLFWGIAFVLARRHADQQADSEEPLLHDEED